MKKKLCKLIGVASLVLFIGGTTSVLADSVGSFSFSNNVVGSTDFKLAKKYTTCDTYAQTYRAGEVLEKKFKYKMTLEEDKLFGKSFPGNRNVTADGYYYTISFGTITKGTYNVNIGTPDPVSSYSAKIVGEGELLQ